MYKIDKIFPTLLHTIDNIPISDECLDYCLNNTDLEGGVIRSNRGGKQTKDTLKDSVVKDLIQKIIDENVQKVCKYRLGIQSYWINVNGTDTYNRMHCHPQAVLAGVIYIQASEDSGDLGFYHPNAYSVYSEVDMYNLEDLSQAVYTSVKPKTGLCYIFPGHLMHGVEPNKTQDNRISVAFNIGVE